MTKKFLLALIFCITIIGCGKKGDPIYKDSEKKTKLQINLTNTNKV